MATSAFKIDVKTARLKWNEELRQRLNSFRDRNEWSDAQISRDMQRFFGKAKDKESGRTKNTGLGQSTVYSYRTLTYGASQESLTRFEHKLAAWLDHREAGGRVSEIDESVEAAKLVQRGLEEAHASSKFVVIVGQSGMGKTLLMRHFANRQTHGGMVIVECYAGMTARAFLAAICRALGERDTGSKDVLIQRAAGVLAETPKILAIDEANFMMVESINHLIYIYNKRNVGIVLAGTHELERVIKSSDLQRVRSRMKLLINLPTLSREEIQSVLEQTFDPKEITPQVIEWARQGSFGGYRDLDTLIETAADKLDKNQGKSLEFAMGKVYQRMAGKK